MYVQKYQIKIYLFIDVNYNFNMQFFFQIKTTN